MLGLRVLEMSRGASSSGGGVVVDMEGKGGVVVDMEGKKFL